MAGVNPYRMNHEEANQGIKLVTSELTDNVSIGDTVDVELKFNKHG